MKAVPETPRNLGLKVLKWLKAMYPEYSWKALNR